ncbi:hypothetical protein SODALDRAFT_351779 [Sodiomyces alkalinus F11]|uniref:MARVEL domain-containing protein n=1 Tax=Sodiomyces alkalinus (strain CBS 110278 / VKM F-3762 / F11) TaxID=1314773 RepID=A0A3N2PSQ2_SODAK|nr:hypothetical protein SODALDRAFT_351779 [Sodiomyces alkalinus F11]ROT37510.1 hypothetical protein SODALDRAFT_351779 [Sodiomyces alkalinus F11]
MDVHSPFNVHLAFKALMVVHIVQFALGIAVCILVGNHFRAGKDTNVHPIIFIGAIVLGTASAVTAEVYILRGPRPKYTIFVDMLLLIGWALLLGLYLILRRNRAQRIHYAAWVILANYIFWLIGGVGQWSTRGMTTG